MLAASAAVAAALALALTGALAGVFYAYSVSVMLGLDAAGAEHAIPVMRSINQRIQNPVFLTSFIGAPLASAAAGALLLALGHRSAAVLFLLAAGVYLVGVIVVTGAVSVPMNNALDAATVPADPAAAAQLWTDHSTRWTWWNSIRAGANTVSLLLIGLGIFRWGT